MVSLQRYSLYKLTPYLIPLRLRGNPAEWRIEFSVPPKFIAAKYVAGIFLPIVA